MRHRSCAQDFLPVDGLLEILECVGMIVGIGHGNLATSLAQNGSDSKFGNSEKTYSSGIEIGGEKTGPSPGFGFGPPEF